MQQIENYTKQWNKNMLSKEHLLRKERYNEWKHFCGNCFFLNIQYEFHGANPERQGKKHHVLSSKRTNCVSLGLILPLALSLSDSKFCVFCFFACFVGLSAEKSSGEQNRCLVQWLSRYFCTNILQPLIFDKIFGLKKGFTFERKVNPSRRSTMWLFEHYLTFTLHDIYEYAIHAMSYMIRIRRRSICFRYLSTIWSSPFEELYEPLGNLFVSSTYTQNGWRHTALSWYVCYWLKMESWNDQWYLFSQIIFLLMENFKDASMKNQRFCLTIVLSTILWKFCIILYL